MWIRIHPPRRLTLSPARVPVSRYVGQERGDPIVGKRSERSLIFEEERGALISRGQRSAEGLFNLPCVRDGVPAIRSLQPRGPRRQGDGRRGRIGVLTLTVLVVAMAVASATGPWTAFSQTLGATNGTEVSGDVATTPSSPATTGTHSANPSQVTAGAPPVSVDSLITPRIVPLDLPGPHPAAWGSEGLPPGIPALLPAGSDPVTPCDVVNPAVGGQSLLAAGCVGHDEPSLSFYSDLSGSGGNLSWNATLPEDASPTQNQSDLYAAAWLGLVVSDPAGWLGQCYVEIQFYPDFSWATPGTSTPGVWAGAAVGWQVDPATGAVDTCYYSPLYVDGSSGDGYFSMAQGDSFQLALLGWTGDPQGEQVWINDTSNAVDSQVTLYNSTGGFPLDPAYSANDVQNALLWTTGGELPVLLRLRDRSERKSRRRDEQLV